MIYNYDFDIAALVLNLILIVVVSARKSYPSVRIKVYKVMLWVHFAATVFDIISSKIMMNLSADTLAAAYVTTIAYYLLHTFSAIIFVIYGVACVRPPMDEKTVRAAWLCIAALELLAITSTPYSHLVFWFDNDLNYRHGPLMYVFYAIAIVSVLYVLRMRFKVKDKQTAYQLIANVAYAVALLGAFVFHYFKEEILIELFAIDIGFLVMYIAQDNPEGYLYKGLNTYNRTALDEKMMELEIMKKSFCLLLFTPHELPFNRFSLSREQLFAVEKQLLNVTRDALNVNHNLYMVDDMCFAMICYDDERESVEKLNAAFAEPVEVSGIFYNFPMAYAVLKYPENASAYNELEQLTDSLIAGVYSHEGGSVLEADRSIFRAPEETKVLNTIKEAVRTQNVSVRFQPVYSSDTMFSLAADVKSFVCYEDGTPMPKEVFLPTAKKYGLLADVDEIVLLKTVSFLRQSDVLGHGVNYTSIRLSTLRLMDAHFGDNLAQLVRKYKLPTNRIGFEINEFVGMESSGVIEENIRRLHDMGFYLILDGFGSEYFNLTHLLTLPFDVVKLSGRVAECALDAEGGPVMLQNLFGMIRSLGKGTACEDVESIALDGLLRECGCEYLQGGYYSKPLDASEYQKFLKRQHTDMLNTFNAN